MNMKKISSLLLALVLVLAMAVPAMATMEGTLTGGSITIDDAVSGQDYTIYQILYLESYKDADGDGDDADDAYSYKANSAWEAWLKTQTTYVSFDAQGYVTWVAAQDDATVAAFAKAAQAYAKSSNIAADKTALASSAKVEFTELNLGYYLVDTTLGTLCSLDTTNPSVVMKEKNEAPTVTKKVQEDSNSSWGETNDADINQVVNFKATITVQAGAENYVLHDTMSQGLTFDANSVKVTVDGATVPATSTTGEGEEAVTTTNYTVISSPDDNCTFEVKFEDAYIATVIGKSVVVEYSAKLNENAVVGDAGNPNEIKLEYGDDADPSYTPVDKTITYTWNAKVVKYTTKDGADVMLAGATFKLSTDNAGANVIKFHALGENKYEVCADTACNKAHVTEITTDATGTFVIEGLDAGTYYLTETAAPAGYNKLDAPETITITPTKNAATNTTGETMTYSTVETKVENNTGTELPSTGGMGTTILYVAGGILVLGAVIVLITKKRMAASK